MSNILLEVCITSPADAETAQYGGVQRLELNSALALGGLTPSVGTLVEVRASTTLPIIAMVRPRPGGFCYSAREFAVLCRDAEAMLAHGADGIAFAVLTAQGEVDQARCRTVRELCGSKSAVFHRAFDVVPQPSTTLEQLIDLGFHRVMSSGQEVNCYNGSALLAKMIQQAAGRIEILPAGGINAFTVADVVTRTGCTQIHASLRTTNGDPSVLARPHIRFGTVATPESQYDATDLEAIRTMRELLQKLDR